MLRTHGSSLLMLGAIAGSLLFSAGASAGTPANLSPPNSAEDTDTRVFAGARWTLGKSIKPELLAGVQSAEVDSSGDVTGLQVSVSYDLAAMGLGKLRFEGLTGNETSQAVFGVGYSFPTQAPFVGMGVRGNHLFGGVDYLFGPAAPEFYLGIDTLDSLDEPAPTCDSGTLNESGFCDAQG